MRLEGDIVAKVEVEPELALALELAAEPEVGSIVLQLSVRQLNKNKLCEEAMHNVYIVHFFPLDRTRAVIS